MFYVVIHCNTLRSGTVHYPLTSHSLLCCVPLVISTLATHCRSLCLYKDAEQTTSFDNVVGGCTVSGTVLDAGRCLWKVPAIMCMCDRPAVTSSQEGNMEGWEGRGVAGTSCSQVSLQYDEKY
jgi:hypothetical protein